MASSFARPDETSLACAGLSGLVWRFFSPMSCSALLLLQADCVLPALPRLERLTEEIQVIDRRERFAAARMRWPLAAGIDDQAGRDDGSRPPRLRPGRDLVGAASAPTDSICPHTSDRGRILGAPAAPVATGWTRRSPTTHPARPSAAPAASRRRPGPARSSPGPAPGRNLPAEAQCRQALALWLTGGHCQAVFTQPSCDPFSF